MRVVGAMMVLAGAAGAVWGTVAALEKRRPVDLLAGLIAASGVLLAQVGGVLLCVPGFLG